MCIEDRLWLQKKKKKKIQKHFKRIAKEMYINRPVPAFGFIMYRNRTPDYYFTVQLLLKKTRKKKKIIVVCIYLY